MSNIVILYSIILFYLLTPGILVILPPKSSKIIVALTHALLFSFIFHLTHKLVGTVEGNLTTEEQYEFQENPQANVLVTSDATTVAKTEAEQAKYDYDRKNKISSDANASLIAATKIFVQNEKNYNNANGDFTKATGIYDQANGNLLQYINEKNYADQYLKRAYDDLWTYYNIYHNARRRQKTYHLRAYHDSINRYYSAWHKLNDASLKLYDAQIYLNNSKANLEKAQKTFENEKINLNKATIDKNAATKIANDASKAAKDADNLYIKLSKDAIDAEKIAKDAVNALNKINGTLT